MKKLFSTVLAVFAFSVLMAQSVTIPAGVQTAFLNANKDVKVEWTVTNQSYVAKWNKDNKKISSVYAKDEKGTLIRTESDAQLTDLSTAAQTDINHRFIREGSGYTFVRAFKVEGLDNVTEGAEFELNSNGKKSNLLVFFDASGVMVKREIN